MDSRFSRAKRVGKNHEKAARPLAFAALLSILLTAPVQAEEVKAGDLVITQPWTRATPGGAKVAGGYLTIENKGATPDRLVSGSTNVAKKSRYIK
jgi:periplasmic copper chaperone A